jgi:hypothetical protein
LPSRIVHCDSKGNVGIAFDSDMEHRKLIKQELNKLIPQVDLLCSQEELQLEVVKMLMDLDNDEDKVFAAIKKTKTGPNEETLEINRVQVLEIFSEEEEVRHHIFYIFIQL